MSVALQQGLSTDAVLGLLVLLLAFGVLCFLVLAVAYAAGRREGRLESHLVPLPHRQ